jgi:hypothetical protein
MLPVSRILLFGYYHNYHSVFAILQLTAVTTQISDTQQQQRIHHSSLTGGVSILVQDPAAQQAAAQELYGSVALELLQQAAKAFERTLLDGGPCRW